MAGIFMTFEGPDGAGKTSVLDALVPALSAITNHEIILTREPGGSKISEEIRSLILDIKHTEMDARTEALLYAASRRQHLIETILPAIEQDKFVICDRFVDSSVAYQGNGREIGIRAVEEMNQFATNGITPDFTLYLDVPAEVGLARVNQGRQEKIDRLDQEALPFHERVRAAYLMIAKEQPARVTTIDATQPLAEVVTACYNAITQRYPTIFQLK